MGFDDAVGRVASSTVDRRYANEPAHLRGTLLLSAERAEPTSQGSRRTVHVEGVADGFAPSADSAQVASPFQVPWAGVAAAAAGFAALLALLWKPLAALFTRLRKDDLLEQASRRRIFETIHANPGVTVVALVHLVGQSRASVRHHLRILQGHGRVRSFKAGGAWRFVASDLDLARTRIHVVQALDPKLRELRLRVRPEGTNARHLVEGLQRDLGLSRSGGWHLVGRAVDAKLVTKERHGRTVILVPGPAPLDDPTSGSV
jgi:predicted transcriptional regulator